ncbi:MAG TPA: hypothetical protein VJV78_12235, partial [Polyangiales bacterium]|nr:hypothetical protein [Polyangiales bacterium]
MALPERIGQHYRVLELLGRGGSAVVYRVCDLGDQREYALKQLLLSGAERDRARSAQFEREFYLLAQLSHPSVIEVYDFGHDVVGPFYTMELLEGGDLSARAPLDYRAACELMV